MAAKDPALFFIQKDVRTILKKLTGCDMNKIFRKGFNPTKKNSEIQLLTQNQLESVNEAQFKKILRIVLKVNRINLLFK